VRAKGHPDSAIARLLAELDEVAKAAAKKYPARKVEIPKKLPSSNGEPPPRLLSWGEL
jgi:hypothetical protein